MESLSQMLEDYRNGERGLPSYDELVAIVSQKPDFVYTGQHADDLMWAFDGYDEGTMFYAIAAKESSC